jgi:hypothetical protein
MKCISYTDHVYDLTEELCALDRECEEQLVLKALNESPWELWAAGLLEDANQ